MGHLRRIGLRCAIASITGSACGGAGDDGGGGSGSSGSESSTTASTSASTTASTSASTTASTSASTTASTSASTSTDDGSSTTSADGSSTTTDPTTDTGGSTTAGSSDGGSTTGMPAGCGDGVLDPGELCDDGDLDDGNWCRAACSEIALDFDLDADGTAIDDYVALDDYYAELGLTLSRVGGLYCMNDAGEVFTNPDQGPGGWSSAPHVVSTCGDPGDASDISETNQGLIRIDFPTLVADTACIMARPDDESSQVFIAAYDADDVLLFESVGDLGVTGEVCVQADGMVAAVFGAHGEMYVRLDDFRLIAP